jgi:hypothetical protein
MTKKQKAMRKRLIYNVLKQYLRWLQVKLTILPGNYIRTYKH